LRLENVISDALVKTDNDRYKLTVAVSRRAVQLSEGDKPLLKPKKNEKFTDIALREIADGLTDVKQFLN
jgi:DNA-directed RNA polymerase subunit omega